MEIRDWAIARELDVAGAMLLHEEEIKREVERERRDRKFWIAMFGGESSDESEVPVENDQVMTEAQREAQARFFAAIQNDDLASLQKKPARGNRSGMRSNELVQRW